MKTLWYKYNCKKDINNKSLVGNHQWDVAELCQSSDICQWLLLMYRSGKGPLQPLVLAFEPFMKWGLDYMTKWVEVKTLCNNTTRSIAKFLYENIITQFGCPTHLVNDQGCHFINNSIELLVQEFMITHHKFTIYYP
jgi:hypothetical protein